MIAIILLVLIVITMSVKWYYQNNESVKVEDIIKKLTKGMDKWNNETVTTENPINSVVYSAYAIGYLRSLHTLVKQTDLENIMPAFNEIENDIIKVHEKAVNDIGTLCAKS